MITPSTLAGLLLVLLTGSANALYEEQAAEVSWSRQHVGTVQHARFAYKGRARAFVATAANAVASLDLRNGEVETAHVLCNVWSCLCSVGDRNCSSLESCRLSVELAGGMAAHPGPWRRRRGCACAAAAAGGGGDAVGGRCSRACVAGGGRAAAVGPRGVRAGRGRAGAGRAVSASLRRRPWPAERPCALRLQAAGADSYFSHWSATRALCKQR